MSFLFDSDVLIRSLNGKATESAQKLLKDTARAISRVTWIEVLAGTRSALDESATRDFLALFQIFELNLAICEKALRPRRETRLKLPDAIIYATALETGRTLVTYNTRDFRADMPAVLIPG